MRIIMRYTEHVQTLNVILNETDMAGFQNTYIYVKTLN